MKVLKLANTLKTVSKKCFEKLDIKFLSGTKKLFFIASIFALYMSTIMQLPMWRFIHQHNGGFAIFVATFIVAYSIFLGMFYALFWKYVGKAIISFVIISASAGCFYSYFYNIGLSQEAIISVLTTTKRESTETMSASNIIFCIIFGVFPSILLCSQNLNDIKYTNTKTIRERIVIILLSSIIAITTIAINYRKFATFVRQNHGFGHYINVTNYTYSIFKIIQSYKSDDIKKLEIIDEQPKIVRKNSKKHLFVLVVGETTRSQNWGLNGYERNTTPMLAKQTNLVNFTDVSSCGTATAYSVPCMFSHFDRGQFDKKVYTENVLDLIQKAGVEVIWYENDDGCKGVCKRIKTIDVQARKHKLCRKGNCKDEILLEDLEKEITEFKKSSTKNKIIVFHIIGSHGPLYYDRYTREFAKFQPECKDKETYKCSAEALYNSYDNTIVYQDYVLSGMINKLKKENGFDIDLLFVSDHGESLGEKGIYLHAFPYSIAPKEQTSVPMFVWTNNNEKYSILMKKKNDKLSHDNIFHSLLGVFGVQSKVYKPELDLFR